MQILPLLGKTDRDKSSKEWKLFLYTLPGFTPHIRKGLVQAGALHFINTPYIMKLLG